MPTAIAGFYTDIVKVEAPDSASAGQTVTIKVSVKNKATTIDQYILVMGTYDSTELYASPEYALVSPQAKQVFTLSFIMPDHGIVFGIWSYIWVEYPDQPGYWYNDEYQSVSISLAAAPAIWQKLATKTITLTPITAPPAVWQKLAAKTITITPVLAGWQKLASKVVTITPPGVKPPPTEEKAFPWTWVALGGAGLVALAALVPKEKPKTKRGT